MSNRSIPVKLVFSFLKNTINQFKNSIDLIQKLNSFAIYPTPTLRKVKLTKIYLASREFPGLESNQPQTNESIHLNQDNVDDLKTADDVDSAARKESNPNVNEKNQENQQSQPHKIKAEWIEYIGKSSQSRQTLKHRVIVYFHGVNRGIDKLLKLILFKGCLYCWVSCQFKSIKLLNFYSRSRKTHRAVTWRLAKYSKAKVLSVDYRVSI